MNTQVQLGRGETWHHRYFPRSHQFNYDLYFLMLPMRSWHDQPDIGNGLARNRFAPIAFYDRDHGLGGESALAWVENLLAESEVDNYGEIWLATFPRVFGYAFKPVSFWLILNKDQSPRLILAEVNNTFGERHLYWLESDETQTLAWNQAIEAKKVFHVSPFCTVSGNYRFCINFTSDRFTAQVDLLQEEQLMLATGWSGALTKFSRLSARKVFFDYPLMTWGVIARIHWQAFKIWRKRVPFFSKPKHPPSLISR